MNNKKLTYRTAASIALSISLVMHIFFLIIYFFGRNAVVPEDRQPMHEMHPLELDQVCASAITVFIFVFLMYILNFKILDSEIKKHKTGIQILGSIIGTVILTFILVHIQIFLFGIDYEPHYHRYLAGNMVRDFFLTLIILFSSQILYLSNKKQQIALENEVLIAENMKSRYETLKNQVDPHFLFNTLNTLNTMIKIDPDKAQEYVQKMSSVFRYTLQNKEETTLEEELKFTGDYCTLMQIRYGESLSFQFDIDKEYLKYYIIPLSIQLLVENAIKHNVISRRQPLEVKVQTGENGTLAVTNPLQLKKEPEPGEGIGLANLTERYRLRFNREVEVECTDNVFRVTIPLINKTIHS